jgi:4-amino-4-deoxy-L-arabinose transferase-like glycosyltransferase
VIILLGSNKPKLWILFSLIIGFGLLNKYSIGFMVGGLVAGLLFTRQRKQLATIWFWLGVAVAAVVFLPHIMWQIAHDFPSLEFMRNASENKNVSLNVFDFLVGQIRDMNIINAPLWLAGIYFFFKHQEGRYRPLGWMYIIVFIVMAAGNAKVYYLSAIYPIFLAGGAVLFDQIVSKRSLKCFKPVYVGLLILVALAILPFALPVLPVEQFIHYERLLGLTPRAEERTAVGDLPQYYADQFGWNELVDTISSVYRRLTPEEQSQCFIYVRNYGEAAAIDFFGKELGLPNARCAHNSYWLWGPGERTGNIAIIVGNSRNVDDNFADLRRVYRHVELATAANAKYCMPYENGRMIFICKEMNTTFQKLWPTERFYI